ncbi:MAG: arginine--tRNA ligase [Caldilineaceae bacterium]|nr:arginine--tRNA ligase [Caldilineaceae bacterium]HRJ41516.1 arginine--tRNA ligase [Caldilineaceae bacterium]
MLRDQIQQIVSAAVDAAKSAGQLPDVPIAAPSIERPKQAEHGDFSTNISLITASAVKQATGEKANPRQIAQAIVSHIPVDGLIGAVELAGPGFINIRLAQGWLQGQVRAIIDAGDSFGNIDRGAGQRWQVEFVSANPTGPLHYGGARNAVLGDALASVLSAAGYAVQREFYVNDVGNQLDLFARSLHARYLQLHGQDAPLPEDGYRGDYMLTYARQVQAEVGDSYLSLPATEVLRELRAKGLAIVLADLQYELGLIGVRYDRWFSEQSLYDDGLVEQMLDELTAKGDIGEWDGARWFRASNYPKNDKDEVVVRSNGLPTYFASDIAYHYDKFVRRGFDKVVNVWSVDHQGHVSRMGAIMAALGLDPERLIIVIYNLVKLVRDGQEVKMSKRSGDFLTLREVVEEVGADAVRFMLLTRGPESGIEFDLDLAVAQKNDNPVYYVQMNHARICSILGKAADEGMPARGDAQPGDEAALALLIHPAELSLIRKILEMEDQIDFAIDKLSPHNLTHYAMELARTFSIFYDQCHVLKAEPTELVRARLLLCRATRTALARVLGLMGMSAPESM